jgi:hypothetical protein
MNFKETLYLRTIDDESFLGFSRCNVFEADNKKITVNDVFANKLLSDKHDRLINKKSLLNNIKQIFKTNYFENEFGAVNLKKIDKTDFKKLDYKGLFFNIEKYWQDENWGEDLQLFKSNFFNVIDSLKEYNLEGREYYYINLEEATKEVFINPECWIYFVGIFSIDTEKGNVIVMYFANN